MTSIACVKEDFLDLTANFFTVHPRDFFNSIHQSFFWNKYLVGKQTTTINNGMKSSMRVFDAFNMLDLVGNLNNLKNHFLEKKIQDLPLLASDTANNFCESMTWLSSCGIVALSASSLNWLMIGSGATLMFSFAKRSINEIKDLINKSLSKQDKNIKMLSIAKNIALFVIGFLLFITGWFKYPLMITSITLCSGITIIANLAIHIIEKK